MNNSLFATQPSKTTTTRTPGTLISLDEAAGMLSISRRTIYRLIAAGELPQPVKVGGSSRMARTDLDRYIDRLLRRRNR